MPWVFDDIAFGPLLERLLTTGESLRTLTGLYLDIIKCLCGNTLQVLGELLRAAGSYKNARHALLV